MSESNPSQPAPTLVSAGMVSEWSQLLPGPVRSAFIAACTEAETDEARLQAIRDHVKVIWLEDDTDEIGEKTPSESPVIWPRHENGQVVVEALGVEVLKSMLTAQQLRPSRLEIRDKRTLSVRSDSEKAVILARDILHGADLAVTEFGLQKQSPNTTIITVELSAEYQGQGNGFSILRKANLCLTQSLYSFLAEDALLRAPVLKELSLSFSQSIHMSRPPSFILKNATLPALERN